MQDEISHVHTLTHTHVPTESTPDTEPTPLVTTADVQHAHVNGDNPHHHVSLDDLASSKSPDSKPTVPKHTVKPDSKAGIWQ